MELKLAALLGPVARKRAFFFIFPPLGIPGSKPLGNYIGAGYRYSGHVSSSSSVVSELVFPVSVSFIVVLFVCACDKEFGQTPMTFLMWLVLCSLRPGR